EPRRIDTAASGNSISGWSPYDGMELPWSVAATWNRGEMVWDGRNVIAAPGRGRFITPPASRDASTRMPQTHGRERI
ncbi:MAG: hypothetical protein E5W21_37125, partial [Mesorhizobium sp.]